MVEGGGVEVLDGDEDGAVISIAGKSSEGGGPGGGGEEAIEPSLP